MYNPTNHFSQNNSTTELSLGYDSLLGHAPTANTSSIRTSNRFPTTSNATNNFKELERFTPESKERNLRENNLNLARVKDRSSFDTRSTSSGIQSNSVSTQPLPLPTNSYFSTHSLAPYSSPPLTAPSPTLQNSSMTSAGSGILSPLSPLVEPFSPSTTSTSLGSVGSFGRNKVNIIASSPPIDLRLYSHQQQQQYQQSQQDMSNQPLQSQLPSSIHSSQQSYLDQTRYHEPPPLSLSRSIEYSTISSIQDSSLDGRFSQRQPQPNPYSSTYAYAEEDQYVAPNSNQYKSSAPAMSANGSREGWSNSRRDGLSDRGGTSSQTPGRVESVRAPASASGGYQSGGEGSIAAEEISTIFVVGFPEDMLEREFQNMFLFSPGFEAATLKVPASTIVTRERERDLVVGLSSAAGSIRGGGGYASDTYGSDAGTTAYEDAFGNQPLDGPNATTSASAATTTSNSAAMAHVLSIAAAHVLATSRDNTGSPVSNINPSLATPSIKKQIIGFAKFKTRTQALEARDILNGKRIDLEKGSLLKAEMAKKQLHTKRGVVNEGIVASSSSTSLDTIALGRPSTSTLNPVVLAELARQNAIALQASQLTATVDPSAERSAFDAFHSISLPHSSTPAYNGLREEEFRYDSHVSDGLIANFPLPGTTSTLRRPQDQLYDDDPTSPQLTSASGHYYSSQPRDYSRERALSASPLSDYRATELTSSPTSSTSPATTSPHLRNVTYTSRSMLQQLDQGTVPLTMGDNESYVNYHHQQSPPLQQPTLFVDGSRSQEAVYRSSGPLTSSSGTTINSNGTPQFNFSENNIPSSSNSTSVYSMPSEDRQASLNAYHQSLYQFSSLPPAMTSPSTLPLQQLNLNTRGSVNGNGNHTAGGLGSNSMPMSHAGSANSMQRNTNPADMNAPKNTLYVGGLPAVLPSLAGPHLEDSLRNAFSRCQGFRRLCFRSKSNGPIVFVEFDDVILATRALQDMYGNTIGGLVKGGIRLSYSKNPLGVRAGVANPGSPGSHQFGQINDYGYQQQHQQQQHQQRPSESVFGLSQQSFDYRQQYPQHPQQTQQQSSMRQQQFTQQRDDQVSSPLSTPIPLSTTDSTFGNSNPPFGNFSPFGL